MWLSTTRTCTDHSILNLAFWPVMATSDSSPHAQTRSHNAIHELRENSIMFALDGFWHEVRNLSCPSVANLFGYHRKSSNLSWQAGKSRAEESLGIVCRRCPAKLIAFGCYRSTLHIRDAAFARNWLGAAKNFVGVS